jgi:hypothetical protein
MTTRVSVVANRLRQAAFASENEQSLQMDFSDRHGRAMAAQVEQTSLEVRRDFWSRKERMGSRISGMNKGEWRWCCVFLVVCGGWW